MGASNSMGAITRKSTCTTSTPKFLHQFVHHTPLLRQTARYIVENFHRLVAPNIVMLLTGTKRRYEISTSLLCIIKLFRVCSLLCQRLSVRSLTFVWRMQWCNQDFFSRPRPRPRLLSQDQGKTFSFEIKTKSKTFCRSSELAANCNITGTTAEISQIYTQSPVLITFCPSTMNKH